MKIINGMIQRIGKFSITKLLFCLTKMNMLSLILYFSGSYVVSFLCSIFESVLLSCAPNYIAFLKKRGIPEALVLEDLNEKIDRPLAAILTLNTISHTIGAAGVGASVVELFGNQWLVVGSIILTVTMLYWTEMLPKTIGAIYLVGRGLIG